MPPEELLALWTQGVALSLGTLAWFMPMEIPNGRRDAMIVRGNALWSRRRPWLALSRGVKHSAALLADDPCRFLFPTGFSNPIVDCIESAGMMDPVKVSAQFA